MSFECRALLSPCLEPFVPNHEQSCNMKLTCKHGRPRVTVESTKQLFVESYTQDPGRICCSYSVWSWDLLGVTWPLSYCSVRPNHVLVDLLCSLKVFKPFSRSIHYKLQTWETKFFIKPSFSGNKDILQKRSKNSLKCSIGQNLSETKTTVNQCWNAQETHQPRALSISQDTICSVKTRILHSILHPYF